MGRGKKKRKAKRHIKQEKRRAIRAKMGKPNFFTLTNCSNKLHGISDRYNYKANMHRLIFKDAVFKNVRYQASIITDCNFRNAKLTGVDFYNSNMRGSTFKNSILKDVVFFNCNLKDVDFENAQFTRIAFISTNLDVARNFTRTEECSIYTTYPKIKFDATLEQELTSLSNYGYIYKYKVLHVNKNKLNLWCVQMLLDNYGLDTYRALCDLKRRPNRNHFYTVYSFRRHIEKYLHL